MIPKLRIALLLTCAVVMHAAVQIPEEHRVELRQLVWLEGGQFAKGASNKNRPESIGRIEESQVVWNKQVYPVDSFTEKAGVVTVVFELGTLNLTRKDAKRLEGKFIAKAGDKHVFRTGGGW